jgi:hypothetical protein
MVWWFKPWCVLKRSWVQSLMDVCTNVFHTNIVYKHVHHGEWLKTFLLTKLNEEKTQKKLYDDVAC